MNTHRVKLFSPAGTFWYEPITKVGSQVFVGNTRMNLQSLLNDPFEGIEREICGNSKLCYKLLNNSGALILGERRINNTLSCIYYVPKTSS